MSDVGGKVGPPAEENDEILVALKEKLAEQDLNNIFEEVTDRLMGRLQMFSEDLSVDYHIVLINQNNKKRYSIIEGKKPSIACKPLEYGIVGGLLKQKRKKYQSIFVQFKYSEKSPTIAYAQGKKLEKLTESVLANVLGADNVPYWNSQKKDFAIAATQIKDMNEKIIGACSVDFAARSDTFPDFSFREPEVLEVFDVLYTFKEIFEKFMYMENSSMIKDLMDIVGG